MQYIALIIYFLKCKKNSLNSCIKMIYKSKLFFIILKVPFGLLIVFYHNFLILLVYLFIRVALAFWSNVKHYDYKNFRMFVHVGLSFDIMLIMIILKRQKWLLKCFQAFGTMLNMIVLKRRNMLFIKIIVFHKMLKTLLYD